MTTPVTTTARRRRRALIPLIGLLLLLAAGGILAARDDAPGGATGVTDTTSSTAVALAEAAGPAAEASSSSTTVAPASPSSAPAPAPTPSPEPPAGASVTSITAPSTHVCSDAPEDVGSTQLTLTWVTTGAASVTISIDDPDGPFATGLPPSGSLVVPAPCAPDANSYYVTAITADGSTSTRSITTRGV